MRDRRTTMGGRGARLALLAGLALAAGGCAVRGAPAAEGGDMGDEMAAGEGEGRRSVARVISRTRALQGGSASIHQEDGSSVMRIQVALQGPPGRSAYHWRVMTGTCGVASGALVGELRDYPVIQMQADGSARAVAVLPARQASTLSVRIYQPTSLQQHVACGDFR